MVSAHPHLIFPSEIISGLIQDTPTLLFHGARGLHFFDMLTKKCLCFPLLNYALFHVKRLKGNQKTPTDCREIKGSPMVKDSSLPFLPPSLPFQAFPQIFNPPLVFPAPQTHHDIKREAGSLWVGCDC